jgi:Dyp-type peroxidase family
VPQVTHSRLREKHESKPTIALNIAFSSEGLVKLGLSEQVMESFPREFRLGMTRLESPGILGDIGRSDPSNWQFGGPANGQIHIALLLYAITSRELDALTEAVVQNETSGLVEIFRQNSFRPDDREPFGFRDGISQPLIDGFNTTTGDKDGLIKPGEFILGYENEYGEIPTLPRIPSALDPSDILPIDPADSAFRHLGLNGSYLVVRKLSQDVAGFANFLSEQNKDSNGSANPQAGELLAARMLGRWRSGAPLVLFPDRDEPGFGADGSLNNDFGYSAGDIKGYACPLGAHIRRANPRDSLVEFGAEESLRVSKRHRIIRSGRIYREPDKELESSIMQADQGLFFIAVNADIRRQFEFIQQTWLNSGTFNGLYQDKDPLLSNNDGENTFTIQACPVDKTIQGLPGFVTVKGGGYFFLPGITALKFLGA